MLAAQIRLVNARMLILDLFGEKRERWRDNRSHRRGEQRASSRELRATFMKTAGTDCSRGRACTLTRDMLGDGRRKKIARDSKLHAPAARYGKLRSVCSGVPRP